MAIQEGKAAPAFSLVNQDGEQISLQDYRGKNVILYFYPKDDTPGCTKEACGFRDYNREIQALDTVILGVSADSPESHRKFIDKHALNFDLLSDPDKRVMTRYDAFGEKKLYGRTVQGVIRSTVWIGPDGKVKKHWPRISKAADHPARVLEALTDQD
jgi:peroxiredoxin Q/BCP